MLDLKNKNARSLAHCPGPLFSLQKSALKQQSSQIQKTNSTSEKLRSFLNRLRQPDLLEWFQRYMQKTESKFSHELYVLKDKSLAICQCYFQSQNYENYGPIFSESENASQSLISAIKKLIFDYILQDSKCNKQIVIQCLKNRGNKSCVITNNHQLKIKKSPRPQLINHQQSTFHHQQSITHYKHPTVQHREPTTHSKDPIAHQNCPEKSKYIMKNEKYQMEEQLQWTLERIETLKQQIVQQMKINKQLSAKIPKQQPLRELKINQSSDNNSSLQNIKTTLKTEEKRHKILIERKSHQNNHGHTRSMRVATIV